MRQVHDLESQGEDIRKMGAGQPHVGAPMEALEYAASMITKDPRQGYTEAIGMAPLRERIAEYYQSYYGQNIDAENICVTAGSSSAFILTFLAAFDAGDRVAIFSPTYPAYRNILNSLNIEAIEIETRAADHFHPTLELLESCGHKFEGMIINSPSNPSGTMIETAELEKICAWCSKNGVRLISDEAYHGITYNTKATTALKFTDQAIILNTFSKYFAMTGWRMGWTVLPDDLKEPVKKLAENLFISPPTISQHLAYKIFDHTPALDSYVADYAVNREILLNELPNIGIDTFTAAHGAFYVYADIHNLSNDSEAYCRAVLEEAKVSITPGTDFDLTRGHGTIRICYADSKENIIEACQRWKNWSSSKG